MPPLSKYLSTPLCEHTFTDNADAVVLNDSGLFKMQRKLQFLAIYDLQMFYLSNV